MLTNANHWKGLVIRATDGETWNRRSVIFRRRDMGHPLPHGRNRRLA